MHRCLSSMVPLTMVEDMPSVSPWTPSHHYIIKCKDWTREYISKLQQLYSPRSPGVCLHHLLFGDTVLHVLCMYAVIPSVFCRHYVCGCIVMQQAKPASSWGQQALMSLQEAILKIKKEDTINKVVLKVFTYMLTQCMFFFYTEWLC